PVVRAGIGFAHRPGDRVPAGRGAGMTHDFSGSLMAGGTPTRALADWCAALRDGRPSEAVLRESARHVLDTLAACAAGMRQPLVRAAIELERGINAQPGPVALFGGPERWTVLESAGLM